MGRPSSSQNPHLIPLTGACTLTNRASYKRRERAPLLLTTDHHHGDEVGRFSLAKPSYSLLFPSNKRRIRRLIQRLLSTPPSRSDKRGFVYLFLGKGLKKVGRTNNIERRKKEWKKQCPSYDQKWIFDLETRWASRLGRFQFLLRFLSECSVERLVHLHLSLICDGRPRVRCCDRECIFSFLISSTESSGGRRHREFFLFRRPGNWNLYIKNTIKHYAVVVDRM